jgi:isoleucyl-tRNA synthetase
LYQSLRKFIPEDPAAGDVRSVHFLSFPEVKHAYFDEDIERQVKRMQAVIELSRNIRERNNISLKVRSPAPPPAVLLDREADNYLCYEFRSL